MPVSVLYLCLRVHLVGSGRGRFLVRLTLDGPVWLLLWYYFAIIYQIYWRSLQKLGVYVCIMSL